MYSILFEVYVFHSLTHYNPQLVVHKHDSRTIDGRLGLETASVRDTGKSQRDPWMADTVIFWLVIQLLCDNERWECTQRTELGFWYFRISLWGTCKQIQRSSHSSQSLYRQLYDVLLEAKYYQKSLRYLHLHEIVCSYFFFCHVQTWSMGWSRK